MEKERLTCQKTTILDYLQSAFVHPSAEEVYLAVKEKVPGISRGTIYRNLKRLKEKGKIQEIPTAVSHYDGDTSSHAHFICQDCDKIFDIFDICRECRILHRKKVKVGSVKNYQVQFYGICQNCQRK